MYRMTEHAGHRILTVDEGITLGSESAAVDLIGHAFGEQADVVVVPAELVDERFYTLRTRVAGDVALKFTNYRIRLVILGDLTERLAGSESLRAFAHEATQGSGIWFLPDRAALEARLGTS